MNRRGMQYFTTTCLCCGRPAGTRAPEDAGSKCEIKRPFPKPFRCDPNRPANPLSSISTVTPIFHLVHLPSPHPPHPRKQCQQNSPQRENSPELDRSFRRSLRSSCQRELGFACADENASMGWRKVQKKRMLREALGGPAPTSPGRQPGRSRTEADGDRGRRKSRPHLPSNAPTGGARHTCRIS